MCLTGLPNDTLFLIASYLPCQQDVYALVRTNRHLRHTLYDFLYEYNSRYYHGSALAFATEQGNVGRIEKLLKGLSAARTKLRTPPGPRWRSEAPAEELWEEDSDEVEWNSNDEDEHPLTRDVSAHPLRTSGYSVADIVQIQKALLAAIEIDHQEIITILLDWGAQVNFYRGNLRDDNPGRTRRRHSRAKDPPPVFLAVRCGHADLVKYLLEKGADPDRYRPSPLYRAVEDSRCDIIAILLKHGGPGSYASVLKLVVQRRNTTMLQFLFDNGVDGTVYGYRALRVAIQRHDQEMVEFLRSNGVDLDQKFEESEGSDDEWDREDGDGMDGTIAHRHSIISCRIEEEVPEEIREYFASILMTYPL
ncbi:ankyrin repeat-containing domain protein [Aspergillus pseudotamarii]|uniref:Ankyrin repeat-containing domain protein n=1 Tax=Aspergillus pseudotamarii TaxID=132259 RepID=A0A5N6T4X2_ASPPS|nr:ankyrin repeat-containing domain protein [Aspergillus pseudotamarii]KAE8141299.1 ankyrin repeat-containing domain protein [Aspergillus pseudotamarii]